MNKFIVMFLAFMVIVSVGLGYADDSSLHKVSTAPHNMEYNELGEVVKEVAVDHETGELTDKEEETEDSWIGIELNNEDGKPISSESYEIDLPDGSTIEEGRPDANAEAHSSGIEPGISQITFPNLDDEAWEKE